MKKWWFLSPIQFPTQGQWWSNLEMHLSQTEQCFDLMGLLTRHELQNITGSKPSLSASWMRVRYFTSWLVRMIPMRQLYFS